METFSLNGTVLKPLPLKYAFDSDVNIKSFSEFFTSGVVFSFTPVLEQPKDLTTNNYTNMILSNKMDISTFAGLTGTAPEFPNYLQTQIKNNANDYWFVGGTDNSQLQILNYTSTPPVSAELQTNFEIVLINNIDCLVRTYVGGKIKYLTFEKSKYDSVNAGGLDGNPAFSFEESTDIENEMTGFLKGAATTTDSGFGYSDITQADSKTRTFSYIYNGLDKLVLLVKGIAPDDPNLKGKNLLRTKSPYVTLQALTGFSETSVILEGGWIAATRGEHTHGGGSNTHAASVTGTDADLPSGKYSTHEDLRVTDGSFYYSRIRQFREDGITPFTDVWGNQIFEYTFRRPPAWPWFDTDNATKDGDLDIPTEQVLDTVQDLPQDGLQPTAVENQYHVVKLLAVDNSYAPLRSFTVDDLLYIRPKPVINGLYNVPSRWHSYKDTQEPNHLIVDSAKSYNKVKNNFVVAATHNDILSSGVMTNFIPLKNQLTPRGQVARGNPYDTDHNVTFREYEKLHTGSNQEFGNTDLVISYSADTSEYSFVPDKLNYFHVPYKISPYELLNINNSSLIESGATPGDSPLTSDKVFKKMEKDYTVVFKDEQNGQWLCSWLRRNPDPTKPAAWVDRYYNPYTKTRTEALTADNDGRVYVDKFTTSINLLKTSADDFFDKISDLTFEPGGYYAYHRVGPNYMSNIINLHKKNQKIDTVSFRNANSFPKLTTKVKGLEEYRFNGDRYAQTNDMDIAGSFTVGFDLHCDDWSKPVGNQIIGNYTNAGIGFFNDTAVTPYITIPDGKSVKIYNTDFVLLHTLVDINPKAVLRKGGNNNIYIIDIDNILHEYDTNFVLQNKTNLNVIDVTTPETDDFLNDKTIYADNLIDADIDSTNIYINTYADLVDDQTYLSFNYHAENKFYSAFTYTPSSTATSISITNFGVYIPKSDSLSLNAVTVDKQGNLWQIYDSKVYKTLRTSIDNAKNSDDFNLSTAAISASDASDNLEAIICDEKDHIWLLHSGNKVTKMDNNRNVLFTTTLTSTPASSTRYIDFVREYTPTGLEIYAIIVNQSASGANVIKVNLDGTVKNTISLYVDPTASTLVPITTFDSDFSQWKSITGYDYLRKWEIDAKNSIKCKFSVQNLYENEVIRNTFKEFELDQDVSTLKPGWHSFAFRFDAELGDFSLFMNGKKVNSLIMKDHRARYSFLNLFKQPLMIGTTPHIGSEILADKLHQKKYYFAKNCKMRQFFTYDKALSDSLITYTSNKNNTIRTLKWNAPAGSRNFVDTVERFFKFDYPGSTSNHVDVVLENTFITDTTVRADIEREVRKVFDNVAPAHVKLNKIEFRQNEAIQS